MRKQNNLKINKCRSSRPEVFCKKGVLRNFTKFTGKHLCQSQGDSAQVFSSEFSEISKNTFCYRTSPVAASVNATLKVVILHSILQVLKFSAIS